MHSEPLAPVEIAMENIRAAWQSRPRRESKERHRNLRGVNSSVQIEKVKVARGVTRFRVGASALRVR